MPGASAAEGAASAGQLWQGYRQPLGAPGLSQHRVARSAVTVRWPMRDGGRFGRPGAGLQRRRAASGGGGSEGCARATRAVLISVNPLCMRQDPKGVTPGMAASGTAYLCRAGAPPSAAPRPPHGLVPPPWSATPTPHTRAWL